ncbi:Uncharacterised protein [Clostridium paraputrificum]|nr:Uncharacterised protein [Clostridium paraputrificum]
MLKSQVNNGNIKEANIIMDRIISKTQNDKLGIYTENVEINFIKKSAMTINIENSKSIYYNSEKTWKEDKENHGLGLKSVEKIVNKYSGILNYEDKINSYEVNAIMWNV